MVYSPTFLAEIDFTSVAFVDTDDVVFKDTSDVIWAQAFQSKYATKDFYDADRNYWKGSLIEFPVVKQELTDAYYGVEQTANVTLKFANPRNDPDSSWEEIVDAEELRGRWVKLQKHDPTDGTSFILRGKVIRYLVGTETEIEVQARDDSILETIVPKGIVTTDVFTSTALDLGQAINLCFGHCRNVPLRNIQNNTDLNRYDYLIGYGTIESLDVDHANGKGVKRNGILVNTVEYTFYDGSQATPYAGYAFLRFIKEQMDLSRGYYTLSADVKGLELGGATAQRNFAKVIEKFLDNSIWGLNDKVNTTSFTNAANALDTITNLYCDGAIIEQRKARDIVNDLLLPARATIERNASEEWIMNVDITGGASVLNLGENDGYYDNVTVINRYVPSVSEALGIVTANYAPNVAINGKSFYTLNVPAFSFGTDLTLELPFVLEHATAKKVLSYQINRAFFGGQRITLSPIGLEGRNLNRGDIITLDAPARNINSLEYKIDSISKDVLSREIICSVYDTRIYDDISIDDPETQVPSTTVDVRKVITKTSDYTMLAYELQEGNVMYTNTGAIGEINLTAMAVGGNEDCRFLLYVDAAQYLRFTATNDEKISFKGVQSAVNGYIRSNVKGNTALIQFVEGEWICLRLTGEWNYDQ